MDVSQGSRVRSSRRTPQGDARPSTRLTTVSRNSLAMSLCYCLNVAAEGEASAAAASNPGTLTRGRLPSVLFYVSNLQRARSARKETKAGASIFENAFSKMRVALLNGNRNSPTSVN